MTILCQTLIYANSLRDMHSSRLLDGGTKAPLLSSSSA